MGVHVNIMLVLESRLCQLTIPRNSNTDARTDLNPCSIPRARRVLVTIRLDQFRSVNHFAECVSTLAPLSDRLRNVLGSAVNDVVRAEVCKYLRP